jgi:ariadne-1
MTCPQHLCNQAVSSSVVKTLCSPEVFATYSKFLTRNFIETASNMRWCPSPGCPKVALLTEHAESTITITCSGCFNEFCFRCGQENHTPLTCQLLEQWQEKCASESENSLWIVSNTKKCPKCKNRIEKNGGCMHMSCKMCRHGFCWHCLQPWEARGHTWNHANCSVHIPAGAQKDEEDTVADLERWVNEWVDIALSLPPPLCFPLSLLFYLCL